MSRSVVSLWVAFAVGAMAAVVAAAGDDSTLVQRGKYLTELIGCGHCHTPMRVGPHGPEHDAARMYSGHPSDAQLPTPPSLPPGPWNAITGGMTAWAGPWGISYGTNLTPVLTDTGYDESIVDVSPLGDWLVYYRNGEIWVATATGASATRVVSNGAAQEGVHWVR